MTRPAKSPMNPIGRWLLLLGVALGILTAQPSSSDAGPGSKLLKEIATGVAGVALLELGKKAAASYRDSKLDQEPDALRDCMLAIYGNPKQQNQAPYAEATSFLQRQRRLDSDTASDIAMSSLIDICEAHVSRPYSDLVRAYYTAVANRANKTFTRYQRRFLACDSQNSLENLLAARCDSPRPAQDQVRLPGEIAAARRFFCALDATERSVIILRGMLSMSFADVGREAGLSAQQAHDLYHNARRRVQSQLETQCGM